jgi:lysyl-tRNA synthetase class 2
MLPGSKTNARSNEQARLRARKPFLEFRARLVQAIRRFFIGEGYLEIETPHLIPAPAPEAHIDAIGVGGLFLHTSPELCMKRLLAAGYAKLFQISKCFREGERGRLHLPEFTLLEWYHSGIDYFQLMEECEALFLAVCQETGLGHEVQYQGRRVNLETPWKRISVEDAFAAYAPVTMAEAVAKDRFDELMVLEVEPFIGLSKPVFLYDYPSCCAGLARLRPDRPDLAERFELYFAGIELANAFSELTDAREQRMRFEQDARLRRGLGKQVYPSPESFLACLKQMPAAAGIALGIDRLTMILTDSPRIDKVVPFTPEEM